MAEDKTQPNGPTEDNEGGPQPAGQPVTFGEASALISFLAVAVYVVGVVTSWVPLARTYTGDYATAWYAVSLIPRTTIIGQGMLLIGVPLLAFLMTTLFAFVCGAILLGFFWTTDRAPLLSPLVFLVFGALVVVGQYLSSWFVSEVMPIGSWEQLLFGVPWYVAFLVLLVWVWARHPRRWLEAFQGKTEVRWRVVVLEVLQARTALRVAVLTGLIVTVVGASAIGALRSDPPLPSVHVAASTSIEGDLLAHVDDFWYVFDEENTLIAIPDREVTEVRITDSE